MVFIIACAVLGGVVLGVGGVYLGLMYGNDSLVSI